FELAGTFGASPVNGGTHGNGTHIPCILYCSKKRLIVTVRIAQEFVVVDLYNKRYLMGIPAAHNAQYSKGRRNSIAAACYGQLNNMFGVKIKWVRSEGRTRTVFTTLVYRENAAIACTYQTAVIQQHLQAAQHLVAAVAVGPN